MSENMERYDDEIDLRLYLEVLWRRKWMLVAVVALVLAAAYGFTRSMEPVYEAEATVLVRGDAPGLSVVEAEGSNSVLSTETALQMLQSRQLAQNAAERLLEDGTLHPAAADEPQGAGAWLQERISTQRVGSTPMVRIRAEATSPQLAAALANAMVSALERAMNDATQADLRAASTFTQQQLERVRQDLGKLEGVASAGQASADSELQRERRVLEELYASLLRQQEELRMRLAVQSSPVQVIDGAVVPTAPVRPRLSLNLAVALVLGGFMGLALIFVLEFFDVRVRSARQIEEIIGAPLLTQIPKERFSDRTARELSGGAQAWETEEGGAAQEPPREGFRPGAVRPSTHHVLAGEGTGHESR